MGLRLLTEGAVMQVGNLTVEGVVSDDSPISLIPTKYVLPDAHSAILMTQQATALYDGHGNVTNLVHGTDGLIHFPWGVTQETQDLEVHKGRIACEKGMQEHSNRMHNAHVKRCLIPKCNICPPCLWGR